MKKVKNYWKASIASEVSKMETRNIGKSKVVEVIRHISDFEGEFMDLKGDERNQAIIQKYGLTGLSFVGCYQEKD